MDLMARCKKCGQPIALCAIVDTNNGPSPCMDPCHLPAWQIAGNGRKILDAALPTRHDQRIAFLERKREAVKTDLQLKFEDADWHGVADAAMDLRDVDCELQGLRY